jgi:hypothetical protein
LILAVLLLLSGVSFLADGEENARKEYALKAFLRDYLRDPSVPADDTTRYPHAFVDLDGHGPNKVIVYLTGRYSCGSGGCNTLVLAPQGRSYRVVSSITITWPPIRLLAARSHGWHDIAVGVAGGGIQPGFEAALSYNGKSYPKNPSVPPARRLPPNAPGKIVLPAIAEGPPLYQ